MMGKKVVMIIPPMDYRDEELLVPKEVFEKNGIEVKVASTVDPTTKCYGMLKGIVFPDLHINDVHVSDFDGFVFVGGDGASYIWSDALMLKIILDAHVLNKIVAAISSAPVLLAHAGIVNNRRIAVWKSVENLVAAKGAFCTGNRVEYDQHIITANGPESAEQFARSVLKGLQEV